MEGYFPVKLFEGQNVAAEVDGCAEQLLHVLLQDADRLVHVHLLTRAEPLPVEMFIIWELLCNKLVSSRLLFNLLKDFM